MKKLFLSLTLIALLTGCAGQTQESTTTLPEENANQQNVASVKNYANDIFSISYPADWNVSTDGPMVTRIASTQGQVLVFNAENSFGYNGYSEVYTDTTETGYTRRVLENDKDGSYIVDITSEKLEGVWLSYKFSTDNLDKELSVLAELLKTLQLK